jgi:glyoxylase-like metal-dependent hydrolase (beta-lactamase superfamily II)
MKKLALYCVKYGETVLPESMMFPDGNEDISVPITLCIYCIRTAGRNILVDAGCDTMPGYPLRDFVSPAQAIREIGLSPDEITDVVITHAHHDHIDGVRHFRNATVHISQGAYEKGRKYIPSPLPVTLFEKETWLTPAVRLREWGGHAKGSSVVEVSTGERIHVLAGDECYTQENIVQKRPTGNFVDPVRAMEFVEHYSKAPYLVHTCHDATLKTALLFEEV